MSDYSLRLWIKILHWLCLINVTEFPSWCICVRVPIIYAFSVFSTARFAMWIQFLQFFLSLTVISLRRIPQRNMYTLKLRCLMFSAVISEKKWHIFNMKKGVSRHKCHIHTLVDQGLLHCGWIVILIAATFFLKKRQNRKVVPLVIFHLVCAFYFSLFVFSFMNKTRIFSSELCWTLWLSFSVVFPR